MKILLLIIAALIPVFSHSTCVVIFIFNNSFYIAADSRRNMSYIDFETSDQRRFVDTVCKINKVGSAYMAISGRNDWDVLDSARKYLSASQEIEAITKFELAMKQYYKNHLLGLKQNAIKEYKQLRNKVGLAQAALMFFENGKAKLIVMAFAFREDKKGVPTVFATPPIEQPYSYKLGFRDHIDKITPEEMKISYLILPPEKIAEKMVELELSFHRGSIGKPIDVFKWSAYKQLEWLSEKRNSTLERSTR